MLLAAGVPAALTAACWFLPQQHRERLTKVLSTKAEAVRGASATAAVAAAATPLSLRALGAAIIDSYHTGGFAALSGERARRPSRAAHPKQRRSAGRRHPAVDQPLPVHVVRRHGRLPRYLRRHADFGAARRGDAAARASAAGAAHVGRGPRGETTAQGEEPRGPEGPWRGCSPRPRPTCSRWRVRRSWTRS
jgi:hypothetical protein